MFFIEYHEHMDSHWIQRATTKAIDSILHHAAHVGLMNTEEFTFRSMFMAAVSLPHVQFQTEWNTFDLLVQAESSTTLIEFKYYITRRTRSLEGKPQNYKGGAGKQNEREFWRCVNKLATQAPAQINERFLVLVYERAYQKKSSQSFHVSYGKIAPNPPVAEVWAFTQGPLEARVLLIDSDSTQALSPPLPSH